RGDGWHQRDRGGRVRWLVGAGYAYPALAPPRAITCDDRARGADFDLDRDARIAVPARPPRAGETVGERLHAVRIEMEDAQPAVARRIETARLDERDAPAVGRDRRRMRFRGAPRELDERAARQIDAPQVHVAAAIAREDREIAARRDGRIDVDESVVGQAARPTAPLDEPKVAERGDDFRPA